MKDISLGNLEELILLILLAEGSTYGVEIAKRYEDHFHQSISLPAIHVVLKRLEKKGMVNSSFGEPTPERGGRRKRYYQATTAGHRVAQELQENRSRIWEAIPKLHLEYASC